MSIDAVLSFVREPDVVTNLGEGVTNYKWGPPEPGNLSWMFAITYTLEMPWKRQKESFIVGRHDWAVVEHLNFDQIVTTLENEGVRAAYGLEKPPIETDIQREARIKKEALDWFQTQPHNVWANHCLYLLRRLDEVRILLANRS